MADDTPLWFTAGAAVWGAFQYWQTQCWKRKEFVVGQVKQFKQDPSVQMTTTMLEWRDRQLQILPDTPPVLVSNQLLLNALMGRLLADSGAVRFSATEVAIRDTFSKFLDWLEEFDEFIQSMTLTVDDVRPYLKYWVVLIGNKHNRMIPSAVRMQLWQFIDDYGYVGVQGLCRRFDYDITLIDRGVIGRNEAIIRASKITAVSRTVRSIVTAERLID